MDKEIILAVAGSGKTSLIINELNIEKRFLIITYTVNNTRNIKQAIINKFGFFPKNIDLFTYFNFLYSFCFRPFLSYKLKPNGILWDMPPNWTNTLKRDNKRFYMTSNKWLYHNRIAKLLDTCNIIEDIKDRLEKYYDYIFIDEIQDFAGHDFNLLKSLSSSKINLILVGDFYQHTFDTSRDGNTNGKLHADYNKYKKEFTNIGLNIDSKSLTKSYRCSPSVCSFITEKIGIHIESHKAKDSEVSYIEDKNKAVEIFKDNRIVKLFYQESNKYNCYSRNWGDCKGENCYEDICVVLNSTTLKHFKNNILNELKPATKNKFYVACSRANNDINFIPEELVKEFKNVILK